MLRKMSNYKVLIVGDSRVRHLQGMLDQTSLNLSFRVIMMPGARLNTLALKTLTELSYCDLYTYNLIIIVGGVNNLTKLAYKPTRHAVPRFTSLHDLVNVTLLEMEKAIGKIKTYSDIPVALASVTGIDLVGYSPLYYGKLFRWQPLIDETIVMLNNRIRGLNRMNGLRTPDLSSDVHRCSGHGGRYRTHYIHLHDGLHPGYRLRFKWTDKIISFCAGLFGDLCHRQDWITDYWGVSQSES